MSEAGIIFAPKWNTPGKSDATGAFIPEAKRLAARRGGRLVLVDNTLGKVAMRQRVLDELASATQHRDGCCDGNESHRLGFVAFFCHGYSKGIQLGFDLTNVEMLATAIAAVAEEEVVVPLYACSTASTTARLLRLGRGPGGDGGFADKLRDALCSHGSTFCNVDAHTTAGHSTMNPMVRRFAGDGSPVGGVGGLFLVPQGKRKTAERARYLKWSKRLKDVEDNLRFDFPWMSPGEVLAELK